MARKSRKNLPQPEQAAASVLLPELEEADKGRTLAVPGFAFYDIMSLKEKQVAASRHLFFWAH